VTLLMLAATTALPASVAFADGGGTGGGSIEPTSSPGPSLEGTGLPLVAPYYVEYEFLPPTQNGMISGGLLPPRGGEIEMDSFSAIPGATVIAIPKTFPGYTYQPDNPGTISSGVVPTDDSSSLLLVLCYTPDLETLAYDLNAPDAVYGDCPTSQQFSYGGYTGLLPGEYITADLPPFTPNRLPFPSRPGYTFMGWSTDPGSSNTVNYTGSTSSWSNPNFWNVTWTGTKTIYAVWQANPYTVNYDTNGGVPASIDSTTVAYDNAGLLPPEEPTRDGYTFAGWTSDEATGTIETTVTSSTPYSALVADDSVTAVTLQAQWEPVKVIGPIEQVTIECVFLPPTQNGRLSGGLLPSLFSSIQLETFTSEPGELLAITLPTFPGYTYQPGYPGSTGSVFYYKPDLETLAYDLNASDAVYGDSPTFQQFSYGGYTGLLPGADQYPDTPPFTPHRLPFPSRPGYTFMGWSTDPGSSNTVNYMGSFGDWYSSSTFLNVDWIGTKTIYAVWQANPYTVNYDTNGGVPASIDSTTVAWGDAGLLPPEEPTRDGYTFAGWTSDETTGTIETTVTSLTPYSALVADDSVTTVTLQAQWEPVKSSGQDDKKQGPTGGQGDDTAQGGESTPDTAAPPTPGTKPVATPKVTPSAAPPKALPAVSLALPGTGYVTGSVGVLSLGALGLGWALLLVRRRQSCRQRA